MARSELRNHRKFKRLVKSLGLPVPYVVGLLECLWQTGYQAGSDLLGDETDVELCAEWPGDPGVLCRALLENGFIDQRGETFHIHDLKDHAPEYVKKKIERRERSATQNKDLHRETADIGRRTAANGQKTAVVPNPTQPNPTKQDSTPPAARGGGVCPEPLAEPQCGQNGRTGFAAFWAAWPRHSRKKGRSKCLRLWERMRLEPRAAEVLDALARFKASPDWRKERGKYIPGPEPWLNDESWEVPPEALAPAEPVPRDDDSPGFERRAISDAELDDLLGVGSGGESEFGDQTERGDGTLDR